MHFHMVFLDGAYQTVGAEALYAADGMARLAALVPTPRMHLTRYHGVFAPHSQWACRRHCPKLNPVSLKNSRWIVRGLSRNCRAHCVMVFGSSGDALILS
jgi:hypothetical protein